MARRKLDSERERNGGAEGALRSLAEKYYEATFERFPVQGTGAGRHEFDAALGHTDPAAWERQGKLTERTLEAVEDLPPQDFGAAGTLDRRALLAALRQERLELVELKRWRSDPQTHLHTAAAAVHDLVVRHGEDLSPVAAAIVARLRRMPRYFQEAAECIERPEPLWRDLAVGSAPAVAALFRSLEGALQKALGLRAAPLHTVVEQAAQSAEEYGKHVARRRPAAAGSFAIGEARLRALMRDRLGVDWSPREVTALARRRIEWLKAELAREAKRLGGGRPAHEILRRAAEEWEVPGGDLLETYRTTVERVRERFAEARLLTYPAGERLLVRPVPEFMRDQFPTAAYSSPGPFDPDQTGIFWVNDLGSAAGGAKARKAERAQHFGLELTCAHEAYPGHHVQFICQNRHPSSVRRMSHHAVYYEGWTLWCEQMLADLAQGRKEENPYIRLQQLHDELWRGWRVVIDVGLQTGTLTPESAARILQREVGFTAGRAKGDVNWYTAAPTVPMSYLIGKLEVLRLKQRRVDGGAMSVQEFNDWVLSFGAIPWRWIEESGI